MFEFKNFGLLKSPEEWSSEKFLTLSREKLREGMLQWTLDAIHTPLTNSIIAKEKAKLALQSFQSIQSFMGDKKVDDPDGEGENVVKMGLSHIDLRDEIYCQIIKQVSCNPSPASTQRGWKLMGGCIATFPPSESFENYLEVYLKNYAPGDLQWCSTICSISRAIQHNGSAFAGTNG
jgi:hypothetical protein